MPYCQPFLAKPHLSGIHIKQLLMGVVVKVLSRNFAYDYVSRMGNPRTIIKGNGMQRDNHSDLRPALRCSSCPQTCRALRWRRRRSPA